MNKEQIIINGVNISGCKCYNKNIKTDCLLYPLQPDACKNNPNCYFKQLARKTQELETICKAFDIEYGYDEETGAIIYRCNKLIEKEKELEQYKQSLDEKNKFLQDLGISASGEFKRIKFYIENLKNKYDEKVMECEELISEKDFYLQKIAVVEQECEELSAYAQRQENQREEYYKEYLKKDKALEEIEEFCITYSDNHDTYETVYKYILDIINKVKEE